MCRQRNYIQVCLRDGNIFIRSCAFPPFSRHIVCVYALGAIDKNHIFGIFLERVSPHANIAGLKRAFKLFNQLTVQSGANIPALNTVSV